ncbi:MAG: multiubiquitin domain-containing protein [Nitrospirae bacterium]|nr:multiubiquitin domain-containing protein [Nitrospirota bacterium]
MEKDKEHKEDHKNEAPGQNKEFTIIVNGREKVVTGKEISFSQVVELSFGTTSKPNTIYTVTYKRGEGNKPEGTMVDGDIVKIKNGMIFNVTATDKS